MSGSERRSLNLLLKYIPAIAIAVCLAPSMACANPFLILHKDGSTPPARETGKQTTKRSLTVGLNENGDLMIQHSDVSLIVAYNPPTNIIDYQERIKIAQRQDCPAISGISLKVSLVF